MNLRPLGYVALGEDDEPLAEQTVRLKTILMLERGRSEQVVATAMTNSAGAIMFNGLAASDYLREVIVADAVVASASATLVAGAMQVRGVAVSMPGSGGMGQTLGWALTGALGGTTLTLWAITYRS